VTYAKWRALGGRSVGKDSIVRPRYTPPPGQRSLELMCLSVNVAVDNEKKRDRDSRAARAGFIEPMLCLAVEKLPEGPAAPTL
jgi:hypothetical protein